MTNTKSRATLQAVVLDAQDPDTWTAATAFSADGITVTCVAAQFPDVMGACLDRSTQPGKYEYRNRSERKWVVLAAHIGVSLCGLTRAVNWSPREVSAQTIIETGLSVVWADTEKYDARMYCLQYTVAQALALLNGTSGVGIQCH